jgi:hypothetical protein
MKTVILTKLTKFIAVSLISVVCISSLAFKAEAGIRFKSYPFSGKSMNIAGSPSNYKAVNLYTNTPGDLQQLWEPIGVSNNGSNPNYATQSARFASLDNINYCINLTANKLGNPVTMYSCTDNDAGQKIRYSREGSANGVEFGVLQIEGTNLCISAPNGNNYTQLTLDYCRSYQNGYWYKTIE